MAALRAALRLEWQLFLLAVQFLTRLPVGQVPYSDDLAIRSVKYYPLVGLVVGAAGALVLYGAALGLPMGVAALLSLGVTLLITGAFHEDGLADTADGLGGGSSKARALEIMRDSRLGAFGALALIVVVGAKLVSLAALPLGAACAALIAGHVLGRMAAVHVIASTSYARAEGAKFPAPQVTQDGYRVALALTLLVLGALVLAVGVGAAALGCLVAVGCGQAMRWGLVRKLGGYTGDGLGAVQQVSELGLYLGVLWWL